MLFANLRKIAICSAATLILKSNAEDCYKHCFYDNTDHCCAKSPFQGDDRVVCGTGASDWKHPDQCDGSAATLTLKSNAQDCYKHCFYDNTDHCCAKSPFQGDDRVVCGTGASDWKHPDQCDGSAATLTLKPLTLKSNAQDCYKHCFYDNTDHCCAKSPFQGDDRVVCGTGASDWKHPDQCDGSAATLTLKPLTAKCGSVQPGQKQIWVPDCEGAGCKANGHDTDCAWCVYDYNLCYQNYGDACDATQQAREAQGVNACEAPVAPSPPPMPATCGGVQPGQKQIWVHDCEGFGCNANGHDTDCAWCVYDYDLCYQTYKEACAATQQARDAQDVTCAAPVASALAQLTLKSNAQDCYKHCFYDNTDHCCAKSPFQGDDRVVCGTGSSDWKHPDQCDGSAATLTLKSNAQDAFVI